MLLLSIDFEDWHQLVHRRLGRADWDRRGAALERQTEVVLALLEELEVRATFFVLGMTAERYRARPRGRCPRPRDRLARSLARARPRPEPRLVSSRRGARPRGRRCGSRRASGRLPGACVLDHARRCLGVRRARRAGLRVRLEPVRLAARPESDCADPPNAVSPARGVRQGAVGASGRRRPDPGGRRCVLARSCRRR